jgi:hypothetical protein
MKTIAFGIACISGVQAGPIENFIAEGLLQYTGLVMTKELAQKDFGEADASGNRSGYPTV